MSKRSKRAGIGTDRAMPLRVWDSFQNFIAKVGIGTGNQGDGATYGFNPVSRNRILMEQMYRGSWIAGMAVDCIAEDMTREGIEIRSDNEPDELQQLDKEAKRLQIWDKIAETIKWSRLYGGAVGLLLVDGQQLSTPLRPETIRKGQFKGILPIDRWVLQPTLTDLVTDLGPDLGKPRFYDITDNTIGLPRARIHYSRVIRLEGVELPHYQRIAENLWGQSVVERLWDRLVAFDSATAGTAQLVYKAHLRTYKIDGLREMISANDPAIKGVTAGIAMMRAMQSNEGLSLMDKSDEFETHQYTFSGLSDVILQFAQQLSGALGVPLVRLFGQSPAGLNSTGESDFRNYYDNVHQQQEARLRQGVELVYLLLHLSVFGREPPKSFSIHFKPLWQMSEPERATVTNTMTAAVVAPFTAGIMRRDTALKELKQISVVTGAFSNISEEEIKDAEDDPPPGSEMDADSDAGPGKKRDAA